MKKKLLHILLAFTGFILNAQNYKVPSLTKSQNYIYTVKPQYPFQISTLEEVLGGRQASTSDKIIESVNYFDGLGRPLEEVAIGQTPMYNDIITFHKYDSYGREVEKYLPFPLNNNGSYCTAYGTIPAYIAHSFYQDYRIYMFDNFPFGDIPIDTAPYAKTVFDNSPLNRVVEQGAPGAVWQPSGNAGHTIKTVYSTNSTQDAIPLFYAVNNSLLKGTDYTNGDLYKTIIKDENWQPTQSNLKDRTTEEFKNKEGQVVLKRTYNNNQIHDTYYVYDYSGNLTFVLPPKAEAGTAALSAIISVLNDLCYQYKYDYKNRLIEKKLPGKETESIVYNNLDQPILTQDAIQKAKGEWLFTKYDAFGRIAYTGKTSNTADTTRETIQNEVDAFTGSLWVTQSAALSNFGGTDIYYNNGAYPNNSGTLVYVSEVLTINYYDTYVSRPAGAPNSIILMESPTSETNTTNVKGLLTTSKVKVLDVTGSNNVWITKLNYYDNKARPVYTYSDNAYLGTVDITEMKLDFIGKLLKTKTAHIRNGVTIAIIDNFIYDHAGRLKTQTQCIGDANMGYICSDNIAAEQDLILTGTISTNQVASQSITIKNATILPNTRLWISPNKAELIALNNYNELGQLQNKKVGGKAASTIGNSAGLQTVDYKYNIRGWLKNINDINTIGTDLFAFQVNYDDVLDNSKKLYNGNISQTQWKTANTDATLKGYIYDYDVLNRLINAVDNSTVNANRYNESLTYDKNGNISSLARKGNTDAYATVFGTMDNLSYTYNTGNRLTKVEDSSGSTEGFNNGASGSNTDYGYDVNGNMISDANKNITSITYNYLNLPTKITFTSGNIQYIYDANGTKLRKIVSSGVTTDYAGAFIYEGNNLKFFSQPEGYVSYNLGAFDYIYQYKDHLGNIRLSYDKNLKIVEENNYYPFGLKQKGYNNIPNYSVASVQAEKYKYNGKELQDELGLNMYDYGARNYDPALGRWMNIDPLAENSRRFSPYNYALNNPVYFIDPDGMDIVAFFKKEGDNRIGKSEYTNIVNGGLGGQFQAKFTENSNGSFMVTLEATENGGDLSKLSDEQKSFYESFNGIANDHENLVVQDVVMNDEVVQVGSFVTNKIDVGDMSKYNSVSDKGHTGSTSQGLLIHETAEQYEFNKMPGSGSMSAREKFNNFNGPHDTAKTIENLVNGNERLKGETEIGNLYTKTFRENNGTTTTETMHTKNNNMTIDKSTTRK
nr:DUF6443 domain-containing protein [uncultured Flavobacterium sp.]